LYPVLVAPRCATSFRSGSFCPSGLNKVGVMACHLKVAASQSVSQNSTDEKAQNPHYR
jgi:hypothetical protein